METKQDLINLLNASPISLSDKEKENLTPEQQESLIQARIWYHEGLTDGIKQALEVIENERRNEIKFLKELSNDKCFLGGQDALDKIDDRKEQLSQQNKTGSLNSEIIDGTVQTDSADTPQEEKKKNLIVYGGSSPVVSNFDIKLALEKQKKEILEIIDKFIEANFYKDDKGTFYSLGDIQYKDFIELKQQLNSENDK